MIHTIVDIILLANILVLSALNRQIDRRIENLEILVDALIFREEKRRQS